MTRSALDHPIVRDYMRSLEQATAQLPPDERNEIQENIRMHLREELVRATSDADVRNILATLGDPYDIVGAQPGTDPRSGRGALEIIAVVLLLIGAFVVPVVGWVVGVVLLWSSKAWSTGQKLLGTFVFPGGLGAVFFIWLVPVTLFSQSCSTLREATGGPLHTVQACESTVAPPWLVIPVAVLVLLAPIVVAVYLLRVAGRQGPHSGAATLNPPNHGGGQR